MELKLRVYDMLQDPHPPQLALNADAVISTLVLEHVPIDVFFETAGRLLKPGGVFLVTNMHSEMGGISQAGFVDPKTGAKIRPRSYAHRVSDVVAEAEKQGFELVGKILERRVDEGMVQVLGNRAKKWVGVMAWFGVLFRKKSKS